MHVVFLNVPIEYYSPVSGGALATIIFQMAQEFERRGHLVTILTPVNGDPVYPAGRVVPVETRHQVPMPFWKRKWSGLRRRLEGWDLPYYEYYLRSFRRQLRALPTPVDAVVAFNDLVAPRYLRRLLPHARILVWFQNEWRTNPRNLPSANAGADLFLTCSGYIRDWMARETGLPAARFLACPSGVDLEHFTPAAHFPESTGDTLRVLFMGRIDPNKGPDLVADAVALLRREGLSISLTVAGGLWFYGHGQEMENPYFRSLKEKMEAAGANYLGHVTRAKLPAVVQAHDVVCVLSRANEPFGLVAVEAMASGCAVIASARGGLPEACDGAALLVNPDDFAAVVAALRALATDRTRLREQKELALARALRAPWSACADTLERALGGTPHLSLAA